MRGITPILAEIADKEPTLTEIWQLTAFFCVVCFVLSLWRPWGVVLASLIATFSVVLNLSWLRDPNEGPAILRELGKDYVTHAYFAGFLPVIAVGAGFLLGLLLRRRGNSKLPASPTPVGLRS